jgi:hypothetical protein
MGVNVDGLMLLPGVVVGAVADGPVWIGGLGVGEFPFVEGRAGSLELGEVGLEGKEE